MRKIFIFQCYFEYSTLHDVVRRFVPLTLKCFQLWFGEYAVKKYLDIYM